MLGSCRLNKELLTKLGMKLGANDSETVNKGPSRHTWHTSVIGFGSDS